MTNEDMEFAGRGGEDVRQQHVVICPLCKSDKLEDISPHSSNGIIGPGFRNWKIMDLRRCQICRIVISP